MEEVGIPCYLWYVLCVVASLQSEDTGNLEVLRKTLKLLQNVNIAMEPLASDLEEEGKTLQLIDSNMEISCTCPVLCTKPSPLLCHFQVMMVLRSAVL